MFIENGTFIVDLLTKSGEFHSLVYVYQRVSYGISYKNNG
jgi:hypothetical protein